MPTPIGIWTWTNNPAAPPAGTQASWLSCRLSDSLRIIFGLLLMLLLLACGVQAQGSRHDGFVLTTGGRPVANATVRVCTYNSTGTPCTPAAILYTGITITTPLSTNTVTTDANGNFLFYAAPGRYDIQISGIGITTYTQRDIILPFDPTVGGSNITTLNGLSVAIQTFTVDSTGTNFNILSSGSVHTFNIPTASTTNRGLLSTTDWNAFSAKEVVLSFTVPLTRTVNTITCAVATGSVPGCLSATDWTTFNGKQAPLGYTAENVANKNAANGYAGLSAGSLLTATQFPSPTTTTFGGVKAKACSGTDKVREIGTDGIPVCDVDQTTTGGTGITTLNTLTATTQTLAIGTTGTAPNWSSVTSTHTLHIPMAATASVTAGLLSKTDYDIFNAKQPALGFTPENVANKGAVSGYAPLNSSSRVPIANLGSGTPDGTKFLRDDGVLAVPTLGGVPTGGIILIISGSCPSGFAEETALNGKFVLGTVAANADIGTSGGADNITPVGSVSTPTFTGNAVNSSLVSAGTPAGTLGGPSASVGVDDTVVNQFPGSAAHIHTFTGSAMGTHQHSTTSTGTNSTPTFTGTQFDNRPAFIKVIFCKKT